MTEENQGKEYEVLKLDSDQMPSGNIYPYELAKQVFADSSNFMRRIKTGALRGEFGLPCKEPGQSNEDFASRVLVVKEDRVSHVITSMEMRGNSVFATIKPTGQYADTARALIDNPDVDVKLALRGFTDLTSDSVTGVKTVTKLKIVTFDLVVENSDAKSSQQVQG